MKELNYYSIDRTSGGLFTEGDLVQAKSQKQALEKFLGKKVMKCSNYDAQYIVSKSNIHGQVYRDWRTRILFKIKPH